MPNETRQPGQGELVRRGQGALKTTFDPNESGTVRIRAGSKVVGGVTGVGTGSILTGELLARLDPGIGHAAMQFAGSAELGVGVTGAALGVAGLWHGIGWMAEDAPGKAERRLYSNVMGLGAAGAAVTSAGTGLTAAAISLAELGGLTPSSSLVHLLVQVAVTTGGAAVTAQVGSRIWGVGQPRTKANRQLGE